MIIVKAILSVHQLNKSYSNSNFTLKDISFSISPGSIVGFIGENGSGKTTTMGAILGTLNKSSGTVKFLGKELDKNDIARKEDIGVVFDDLNFSGNLNIIQLANVFKNIYKQWNTNDFHQYIDTFNLPTKDMIKNFSRGMSMKLSIAVALSHDAKLLILDEATAGLDPVAREEILELLRNYVKKQDRSILLSSHMTSDIEKIADELIFIKNGEVILHERKDDLIQKYAIVTCQPNEYEKIDHEFIVASRKQEEFIEVLVANRTNLPQSWQVQYASIDDISLLLMRGVHRERINP